MTKIQFTHLTKSRFNGIMKNHFGNVPLEKSSFIIFKRM